MIKPKTYERRRPLSPSQRNERTTKIRKIASDLAGAVPDEEELTRPNVTAPLDAPRQESAAIAVSIMRALPATWPQVFALGIIVSAFVYYLTRH